MPAASDGETCDVECGRSAGLWVLKLPEELTLGVAGREEPVELTTEGGYHESVEISSGRGWACCSWEPLYIKLIRSYSASIIYAKFSNLDQRLQFKFSKAYYRIDYQ